MNKKGVVVSMLLSVIKLILGALVIIALLAGCYKIYSLTLPSIDSGTEKSFNQLAETIQLMSPPDYNKANPIPLETFYIAPNLALVSFNKHVAEINVDDCIFPETIPRPYQCGAKDAKSCLVICYYGENINSKTCNGEYLKMYKTFDIDSFGNVELAGEGKCAGFNQGIVKLAVTKNNDNTFSLSKV